MGIVISCTGQKGGGSKSAIARSLAVGFTKAKWKTFLADIDVRQRTSLNWTHRRDKAGLSPIECGLFNRVDAALRMRDQCEILIIDGRPAAETTALDIALDSDLILVPCQPSIDDMQPSLELARELCQKGVSREKIVFVISKAGSKKDALSAIETIKAWGFNVLESYIRFQTSYTQALDGGKALQEASPLSLRLEAKSVVEEIANIIIP